MSTSKLGRMLRWSRDRFGDYVWGPYRLVHLHARGGWSSWNVEKNGAYIANLPRLADAKKRASIDAGRAVLRGES
jgi:hypothetical protein